MHSGHIGTKCPINCLQKPVLLSGVAMASRAEVGHYLLLCLLSRACCSLVFCV